jgi:NitT/TauT family transport system substrate-binding protein
MSDDRRLIRWVYWQLAKLDWHSGFACRCWSNRFMQNRSGGNVALPSATEPAQLVTRGLMRSYRQLYFISATLRALALIVAVILPARAQQLMVRIGHFPNITHVQALVAHGMSRKGEGWFEQRLGPNVKLEWYVYNAGPSAMEAIFADTVDLTYAGPSPAINAYSKARGEEIRIVAGTVDGGAALVVQPDSNLRTPDDFRGKRIATPQLGNTQDVSARSWLAAGGLRITLTGGDAHVLPTDNPDQLALFKTRQIDAVWTVEPWVSRLEMEAQGRVLVDEKESVTTVLVSSRKLLDRQRDLVRRLVAANAELTTWIRAHPAEAQAMVRDELAAETHTQIGADLVTHAWARIVLTTDVNRAALESFVSKAQQAGFLRGAPDLARLVETP